MNTEEREIDLLHMLESLCLRWRLYLVWMIIGLVVGGAISVVLALQSQQSANHDVKYQNAYKNMKEAERLLLEEEKGDELKENADNNILVYRYQDDLYNLQEQYTKNSIYYHLNGDNVSKAKLIYYVDNHFNATYPVVASYNNISDIVGMFVDQVESENVCNQIIASVYSNTKTKYIKELLSVRTVSQGSFCVEILAKADADVMAIAKIIQSEIGTITEQAKAIYGDLDVTLQSEQYFTESDSNITNAQATETKRLVDYYDAMQKIKKSMSGAQLGYFEARLSVLKLETVTEEEEAPQSLIHFVSKKLIAIAGILGIFIAGAYVACGYLFSGVIKTVDDVILPTGAMLLGSVEADSDKKLKGIDKLINRIFHGKEAKMQATERIAIVAAAIVETMKNREISKLCITGTAKWSEDASINELVAAIEKEGMTVTLADQVLMNSQGPKAINEADLVVICERLNVTKYADVEQETRLCKLYNANVCGCIVV